MEGRILKIVIIGLVLCLMTSTSMAKKATEEGIVPPDSFGDGEEPRPNQEHLQEVFGNIRSQMLEKGKEIPSSLLEIMMDLGILR